MEFLGAMARTIAARPGPSARARVAAEAARIQALANEGLRAQREANDLEAQGLEQQRLQEAVVQAGLEARKEEERLAYHRDRQRRRRRSIEDALQAEEAHEADLARHSQTSAEVVNRTKAKATSRLCARYVSRQLQECCSGPLGRKAVLEFLFDHCLIRPHMPEFYFRPEDARICAKVVSNVRVGLDEVKGVQSAEKLAYRGALLNCVVGDGLNKREICGYARI